MRNALYPKLALQSIRNNRKFYFPYIPVSYTHLTLPTIEP